MEESYTLQQEVLFAFIDYKKAFDCVDHQRLWCTLRVMGVPLHLITLLRNLYADQTATVRTELGETNEFGIGRGVRQGCVLSPLLFNTYAEEIIREALDGWKGGIRFGGRKLTNLRYADDTTILASTKEELEDGLRRIKTASETAGLYLNLRKTKVMTTGHMDSFELGGENVEVVDSFVFLGAKITADGRTEGELRRRIGMGRSAMMGLTKVWKDRGISRKTKIRLVRALVYPIVLYGAETWTMLRADWKRIDAFEMWCWRRLLRIPWTARKTNEWVLQKVQTTRPLQAMVVTAALRYFGHVTRKDGSLEKDIMFGRMEGRRRRGRPRNGWLHGLRKATDWNVYHLAREARDRTKWKRIQNDVAESRTRLDGTR